MPWPCADVREAQFLENLPKPHFGEINTEALAKNALQVHTTPAHHPMLKRIGPCLHQFAQSLFLFCRKSRRTPGWLDVDQTSGTLLVEAMHPIPQRLAVHPADARGLLAIHPVVNRRNRQQPPRLIGVLYPPNTRNSSASKSSRTEIAALISSLPNQSVGQK